MIMNFDEWRGFLTDDNVSLRGGIFHYIVIIQGADHRRNVRKRCPDSLSLLGVSDKNGVAPVRPGFAQGVQGIAADVASGAGSVCTIREHARCCEMLQCTKLTQRPFWGTWLLMC